MNSIPKVSVIVAAYNAERFINRCLDSVLAQTMPDFEVIVVDDGSRDGTGPLADAYAARDCRVRVIHKENGGVSSARNKGLEGAKGEWTAFLDADDLLEEDCLSLLIQNSNGVDAVFGGYESFDESGNLNYRAKESVNCCLDRYQVLEEVFHPSYAPSIGAVWAKLFKSSVIRVHGLRFNDKIRIGEDRLFVTAFVCKADRVLYFTDSVYKYIENSASAMSVFSRGESSHALTDLDAFLEMKRLVTLLPQHDSVLEYLKEDARGHFQWISQVCSFVGWRGVLKKLLAHWRLLRILSVKDYVRFVVIPAMSVLFKK